MLGSIQVRFGVGLFTHVCLLAGSRSLNKLYLANSHPAGVMPSDAKSLAATTCFLQLCKRCSLLRPRNDTAAHHMISRVTTRTQIPM